MCHAQGVARKSFAWASYPGRPSPQGIEYSYHAAGAMARVRARAVHLHGINTLYHAVSVYTGMHKTLETLETLALRARVSKPVSAVLYIPVYTSTAWYNLYVYSETNFPCRLFGQQKLTYCMQHASILSTGRW